MLMGIRDKKSAATFDLPGRYFMSKLKSANSETHLNNGNDTDGETLHPSADQTNSLHDVNLSSAPATTSTADDTCNNNHNNVNKVGAVHKSSPAQAPCPPPTDDNNNNCNNRHIQIEFFVPHPLKPHPALLCISVTFALHLRSIFVFHFSHSFLRTVLHFSLFCISVRFAFQSVSHF